MKAPTLSLETLVAAMKAPAMARLARYKARVEAHLPTLADDAARHAFLRREELKWVDRYQNWALKVDTGTASKDDLELTAFDFIETIAVVRQRKDDFAKEAA
jgi:hypothetical protein